MYTLTADQFEDVSGGNPIVIAIIGAVGAVAAAAVASSGSEKGPSATLSNGTKVQCGSNQTLEVDGNHATCK